MKEKIKIVVLFGGKSTEHAVSCRSAAFVINNLDTTKYEVIPVGIDQDGVWWEQDYAALAGKTSGVVIKKEKLAAGHRELLAALLPSLGGDAVSHHTTENLAVFSVLHGTYGEDGCFQGLFDMNEIAYVGADRLSSAIGMDKVIAKRLAEQAGIAVVPYFVARMDEWRARRSDILRETKQKLPRYPLFVKPASLGSSVGISKVKNDDELEEALELAFSVDEKVLVEQGLGVREIEFAALGGYEPEISVAGEIASPEGFYTYSEKYSGESRTKVMVPAELAQDKISEGMTLSKRIFMALGLYGMARIDLFLEQGTNKYYFNEVNTLPGFTSISQYPLLWQHMGVSAQQLLDRLITQALERATMRRSLDRLFHA